MYFFIIDRFSANKNQRLEFFRFLFNPTNIKILLKDGNFLMDYFAT